MSKVYLPLIKMRSITKQFNGSLVNDCINFDIYDGEIQVLWGENGSGKSTLMKILTGYYRADQGSIYINGNRVNIKSPHDAIKHKIGMVHQQFKLIDVLTVTENIIACLPTPRFYINKPYIENKVKEIIDTFNIMLNPKAYVWQLSAGEKQRLEILRLLLQDVNTLILDEPTQVLSILEVKWLFDNIRTLVTAGKTVVLITHKIKEAIKVADRFTVLKKGRVIYSSTNKSSSTLSSLNTTHYLDESSQKCISPLRKNVLDIQNITIKGDYDNLAIEDLSLSIHSGEIYGIAGSAGNGQRELAEAITGLRKVYQGSIKINDQELANRASSLLKNNSLSYVPEDRLGDSLFPNLSVEDNIILKAFRERNLYIGPFISKTKKRKFINKLINNLPINGISLDIPLRALSGGNQQKVLLIRELSLCSDLLILFHPTRGLDINSVRKVREWIAQKRNNGTAILLISEDLEEITELSDKYTVMEKGKILEVGN